MFGECRRSMYAENMQYLDLQDSLSRIEGTILIAGNYVEDVS